MGITTRRLIRALARYIPVVIISGRSLLDIKTRVGLKNLVYVGNHGLEIEGAGLRFRMKNAEPWRRRLKILATQLRRDLENLPGIFIEDKGCTLSVHYRLAGGAVRRKATKRFRGRIGPVEGRGRIRITRGKAVWEIRPPLEWDKGRAVKWILGRPQFRKRWPLYIGDDVTDQDAFRAIRRIGLAISVGPWTQKGSAHLVLKDPKEVHQFLRRFLGRVRKESGPAGFLDLTWNR